MSTWSCIYCTLINDPFYTLCQGCGSQKPLMESRKPTKSVGSMVPKIITDTVRDVSNAISDLVTIKERKPAHNFVRVSDFRSPLPNGPFVDGQSNDPRINQHPSTSTFFVDTPETERPNRYENIDENPEETHHLSMCSEITKTLKREAQKESDVIYDGIIQYCTSSNSPFIDDQFLHNKKSIGVLHFTKNGVKRHEEPDFLHWLRPSQMFTKDGRSFPWSVLNNPRPSDIEQGTLVGDCWLMSAMALIAERPDVLDEIIPRKQYSHFGVYQIKLCVEGKWKVVIVDDFFPCYQHTNSIAMAVGRRNQLWVPLIEKAMAKELGSYSKLHGASLTQGLSMLTGSSCVNYNCPPIPRSSDDVDTFWAQLVSSKESGFLMCCHCGAFENTVAETEFRAMGLLTNHAYSILDVVYEHGHRLLRIRNPWGQFVWNGKWSDGWPGWPSEMKQRLLNKRRDETGAFWMDLDDFVTRFASVTVCKLRMDWSELRVTQKIGGRSQKALQMIITETCEVSVTAFQKGAFNKMDNLNDLMVCVHKTAGDGRVGELIEMSARIADNHFTIDEFFLAPGEYTIICHSQRAIQARKSGMVNIVVHTRFPIFAELVPLTRKASQESLHQVIIKEGDVVQNTNNGVIIRTLTNKFRGMIIMADNCLENKYLHVGVDCTQSMNIQSSRGMLQIVDVVPPLSRQVLIVLSTIDDSAQYRVSNSLKTLVHRQKYLLPEMWYEAAISAPKSQHYPQIDPSSDFIHSITSVF